MHSPKSSAKKRCRPATPVIKLIDKEKECVEKEPGMTNDYALRNFNSFMKVIIDSDNNKYLNGDKSVIKSILSKYLNIPENELQKIKKLSIIINNTYDLLNQFGEFLTDLLMLKLNNSNVQSLNVIGTNFKNIRCLQMKNCGLKEISGIECLQSLQIIDLENNHIKDLTDIDMCGSLSKINLSKNDLDDDSALTFLFCVDNLTYLDIRNNPLIKDEETEGKILWKKEEKSGIIILYKDDEAEKEIEIDVVSEFDDKMGDASVGLKSEDSVKSGENLVKSFKSKTAFVEDTKSNVISCGEDRSLVRSDSKSQLHRFCGCQKIEIDASEQRKLDDKKVKILMQRSPNLNSKNRQNFLRPIKVLQQEKLLKSESAKQNEDKNKTGGLITDKNSIKSAQKNSHKTDIYSYMKKSGPIKIRLKLNK